MYLPPWLTWALPWGFGGMYWSIWDHPGGEGPDTLEKHKSLNDLFATLTSRQAAWAAASTMLTNMALGRPMFKAVQSASG